ncbi:MAG: hypothetical protein PVI39_10615 [Desulfobacteraceae bacterium]|jgi:hypothetical protein
MDDPSDKLIKFPERVNQILAQYSRQYEAINRIGRLWDSKADPMAEEPPRGGGDRGRRFVEEVQSSNFDATYLQKVVEEIKLIEESLKTLIAARTRKIVEERVPVERQRPVAYGLVRRLLVKLGWLRQKVETFTDYEVVRKEVPREPNEVAISEFRGMIERYIASLVALNDGLRGTVHEVSAIVQNLTDVSDAYTDQIHRDRKAYYDQIRHSRSLEEQLGEIAALHESLSPLNARYPEVEKARDHLEMALGDSQGVEFKLKTGIDMSVNYQAALKSYRRLINDFKERGDIHVSMVEKFAQGASHMKIAVDNVSQICSGVAKVTQSMIMIVESIEGGNKVLGRYAALIGDGAASSPQWDMEYSELKVAEAIYEKNSAARLQQLERNRQEIESLITPKALLKEG